VRCLLCQGALPSTKNEVVETHFQDQHRAYFNIDFLFKSSFLQENEISRTLDFMLSIVSNTNVEKEHDANIKSKDNNKQIDGHDKASIKKNHEEADDTSFNNEVELKFASNDSIDSFSIRLFDPLEVEDIFSNKTEDILNTDECKTMNIFPIAKTDSVSTKIDKDGNVAFHCIKCDETYQTETKLKIHQIKIHDIRKKTCHICYKEVIGTKRLNNHMRKHKFNTCKSCDKKINVHSFKKHTRSCSKKEIFVCTSCNFKTYQSYDFRRHNCEWHIYKKSKREMMKEKEYMCHLCEFVTKVKKNLNRHEVVVHYSVKHNCSYCKKKFNSETVLNRHVTKAHMESGQIRKDPKVYYCGKCDYKSKTSLNVLRHQSTHSKPKSEKKINICHLCSKEFKRVRNLRNHVKSSCKSRIFVSM